MYRDQALGKFLEEGWKEGTRGPTYKGSQICKWKAAIREMAPNSGVFEKE
jgi:hypothetical protein